MNNDNSTSNTPSTDFIRAIIQEDNRAGKRGGSDRP